MIRSFSVLGLSLLFCSPLFGTPTPSPPVGRTGFLYEWTPTPPIPSLVFTERQQKPLDANFHMLLGRPRDHWRFNLAHWAYTGCAGLLSLVGLQLAEAVTQMPILWESKLALSVAAASAGLAASYHLMRMGSALASSDYMGWELLRVQNRLFSANGEHSFSWVRKLVLPERFYYNQSFAVPDEDTGAYRNARLSGLAFYQTRDEELIDIEGDFSVRELNESNAITATRRRPIHLELKYAKHPFKIQVGGYYSFLEGGFLFTARILGITSEGEIHFVFCDDLISSRRTFANVPVHRSLEGDVFSFEPRGKFEDDDEADTVPIGDWRRTSVDARLPHPSLRSAPILFTLPTEGTCEPAEFQHMYERRVRGIEDTGIRAIAPRAAIRP